MSSQINTTLSSGMQSHSQLWREAYERLDKELRMRYEAIVRAELNVSLDANLEEQAVKLVGAQRQRIENRQWMYKWRGRSIKVRDQADTILDLVQKAASVVAVGMNYAPVYISLPWTAITALLPFAMNDSKEHHEALTGLSKLAFVVARYDIVEHFHIETSSKTFAELREAIVDLYSKIFQYQARLANYLGKNTFKRFNINALTLGSWSDQQIAVEAADQRCQRLMALHDSESLQTGYTSLKSIMDDQMEKINILSKMTAAHRDERFIISQIQNWVSEIDVFDDHIYLREEKLGTEYLTSGQWLFTNKQYLDWNESRSGALLLRGSMGTGKSSLTSILVEHLLQRSGCSVGFFYCSKTADTTGTATSDKKGLFTIRSLMQGILRQLILAPDGRTMSSIILDEYENRSQASMSRFRPSRSDLIQLLADVIEEGPGAVIVIDALDEFGDYEDLLTFLADLMHQTQKLRVFLSARQHVDSRRALPFAKKIDIADYSTNDIRNFIESRLFTSDEKSFDEASYQLLAEELQKVLCEQASGMFHWVTLQLNLFLRIGHEQDFEQQLQRLKQTVLDLQGDERAILFKAYDDMYDVNIGRTPKDSLIVQSVREQTVQRILLWTLCAFRPLHLKELLEAVTTNEDGPQVSNISEDYVLSKGSNFIRQDIQGLIVFTHLSVREYLRESSITNTSDRFWLGPAQMHFTAAMCSLRVLASRIPQIVDWEFLQQPEGHHRTFVSYCCTYWPDHVRASQEMSRAAIIESALVNYLRSFSDTPQDPWDNNPWVNPTSLGWPAFVRNLLAHLEPGRPHSDIETRTIETVTRSIKNPHNKDLRLKFALIQSLIGYQFPLEVPESAKPHWAKRPCCLSVAVKTSSLLTKLTLHYGASLRGNAISPYDTILHQAAASSTSEVIRILLEDPSAKLILSLKDSNDMIPLDTALEEHNFDAADALWSTMIQDDEILIEDSTANAYMTSLSLGRSSVGSKYGTKHLKPWVSLHSLSELSLRISSLCSTCNRLLVDVMKREPGNEDFHISMTKSEIQMEAANGCCLCRIYDSFCRSPFGQIEPVFPRRKPETHLIFKRMNSMVHHLARWRGIAGFLDTRWYMGIHILVLAIQHMRWYLGAYLLLLTIFRLIPLAQPALIAFITVVSYRVLLSINPRVLGSPNAGVARQGMPVEPTLQVGTHVEVRRYRSADMNLWRIREGKKRQEFEVCHGESELFQSHAEIMKANKVKVFTQGLINTPDFTKNKPARNLASGFRSCAVLDQPTVPSAIPIIKKWFGECTEHLGCRPSNIPNLPKFVLDVSSPDHVMLCQGGVPGEYCLYSGVWGNAPMTAGSREWRMERLPRAWREAAEITRLLGFHFLWIDALCISQNDLVSWSQEILRIPTYIQDASLVIAVTRPATESAFENREPAAEILLRLPYSLNYDNPLERDDASSFEQVNGELLIRKPVEDSITVLTQNAWAKRGWTIADRYLPTRSLIITETQMFWNCNTVLRSEASNIPQDPIWRLSCSSFYSRRPESANLVSHVDRSMWYSLVEYYTSSSDLTHHSDRLPAIRSLATSLSNNVRYLAGIWQDDLHVGLAWRKRGPTTRFGQPSWSWACLTGAVSFSTAALRRLETHEDANIMEIELLIEDGSSVFVNNSDSYITSDSEVVAQYGAPISGYLIIRAMTRTASLHPEAEGCQYLFDLDQDRDQWHASGFEMMVLLISQWQNFAGNGCCWYGLLLRRVLQESDMTEPLPFVEPDDGFVKYRRAGLYIGPLKKLGRLGPGVKSSVTASELGDEWIGSKVKIV